MNRYSALYFSFALSLILLLSSCVSPKDALQTLEPLAPVTSNSSSTTLTAIAPTVTNKGVRLDSRGRQSGIYDIDTNKTFVTWTGGDGKVYAQMYTHGTSTWSGPVQTGIATTRSVTDTTLPTPYYGLDGHYYSTITQAKKSGTGQNKLLVFHGQHYDGPNEANDNLKLNTSPNASDVSGTWTEVEIPQAEAAAYPAPVRVANGDIYVFYREQSPKVVANSGLGLRPDDRPESYIYSTDNGITWISAKTVAPSGSGDEPGKFAIGSWYNSSEPSSDHKYFNEIYLGQARYQPAINGKSERINLVYTLAGGNCPTFSGSCHDYFHKDVYYAYLQPSNKHFYCLNSSNVSGIDLGASLSRAEMVTNCRLENTGAENTANPKPIEYYQFVHFTDSGNPIVVYRRETSATASTIKQAVWSGTSWTVSTIAVGGTNITGYASDLDKVGDQSFIFYVQGSPAKTYVTDNAGTTWTQGSNLAVPSSIRTVAVIENYRDPIRLFVSQENSASRVNADMYAVGIRDCTFTGNYRVQNQSASTSYLHGTTTSPIKTDLVAFSSADAQQKWIVNDVAGDDLRWCNLKFQSGSNTYYLHYNSTTTKADVVANPSAAALNDPSYRWKIENFSNGWYTIRTDPAGGSSKYLSAPATGIDTVAGGYSTSDTKVRWQLDPY
jgi:hypothetical protein